VGRLNAGIHSVSDDEHYVTFLLAEIDARKRTVHFVNCSHNSALLFRAKTGTVMRLNSSCPPIGIFPQETCELDSAELVPGDVLVFDTDGLTEVDNPWSEKFGAQRLSTVVGRASLVSTEGIIMEIFDSAVNFCSEGAFGLMSPF
jgi:phosphoserine phosphatase RsbU/P